MILFYTKVAVNKGRVDTINNFPEKLTVEERNKGIEVDFIPEPIAQTGMVPIMYVDLTTYTVMYEYAVQVSNPLEEIKELQSQNTQILLALVTGGLM